MEITQILNLVTGTPMVAVLLYLLIKEQAAHAITRLELAEVQKAREKDSRDWAMLMVEVVMGRNVTIPTTDSAAEDRVIARLNAL